MFAKLGTSVNIYRNTQTCVHIPILRVRPIQQRREGERETVYLTSKPT